MAPIDWDAFEAADPETAPPVVYLSDPNRHPKNWHAVRIADFEPDWVVIDSELILSRWMLDDHGYAMGLDGNVYYTPVARESAAGRVNSDGAGELASDWMLAFLVFTSGNWGESGFEVAEAVWRRAMQQVDDWMDAAENDDLIVVDPGAVLRGTPE